MVGQLLRRPLREGGDGRVDDHLGDCEAGENDRGGRHADADAGAPGAEPEDDCRDAERQADPEATETTELDATVSALSDAIDELRELARGVRPAGLDDGLAQALQELAARSSLRTTVEVTDERFPDSLETAAYFVASEALANAAKHARASEVAVSAVRRDGRLVVSVRDDGVGGAQPADGSGLVG